MGCRTRVIGNVYDPEREISNGRGNLSFTSINLPRLAIKANHNIDVFFEMLDQMVALTIDQLFERFEIQARKRVRNFPFLMGQGVWIDSEKLDWDDEVREVLKHGTLSVGFIGLAETLKALIGVHHGESEMAQNLGLEIIGHMRELLRRSFSPQTGMNVTLLATPAEGLSGRFVQHRPQEVRCDSGRYGSRVLHQQLPRAGLLRHQSAAKKIRIEAPYHALTNAGHISYVELDGDATQNLEAFEKIVRLMKESGIGYGSINHPVDRDPVCGYNGVIGDTCPNCGRSRRRHPLRAHPPHHRLSGRHARPLQQRQARGRARPRQARHVREPDLRHCVHKKAPPHSKCGGASFCRKRSEKPKTLSRPNRPEGLLPWRSRPVREQS